MAKESVQGKLNRAIDSVCAFLARRDLKALTAAELESRVSTPFVDVIFCYGCDLTEVPECAADAYRKGLCKAILFSGGVGHGTQGLRENVKNKYGIDCSDGAEAVIMAEIANRFLGVPKQKIYIENRSTNSGENAKFSMNLLEKCAPASQSILLMQDPLMQRRSHLATVDPAGERKLLSFAPFIPRAEGLRPWPDKRFFDLILREIPRIYDDENGYGPRGKNFIPHEDIPGPVMQSYRYIREMMPEIRHT